MMMMTDAFTLLKLSVISIMKLISDNSSKIKILVLQIVILH